MAFTRVESSYAEYSTGATFTIDKPTGVAEGDIMFALVMRYELANPTSTPADWTLLTSNDMSPAARGFWYYKVAGSSEPSSYSWTWSTSSKKGYLSIVAYRGGFDTTDPIDAYSDVAYKVTDTNLQAGSVDVGAANSPLVFFGGTYSTVSRTFTAPTDYAEDFDAGGDTSDFWQHYSSEVWSGSGSTGTVDATMNGNATYKHAILVALNPEVFTFVAGAYNGSGSVPSATTTIDKPTGVAEGDIMFAFFGTYYTGACPPNTLSGWAAIADAAVQPSLNISLFYRVAGASEPSDYTWTWPISTLYHAGAIVAYRGGFDTADPIDVYSNTVYTVNNTTLRAAGVTVSETDSPILFVGGVYSAIARSFTPPGDYDEDYDYGTTAAALWTEVASRVWTGSGATGDVDATINATHTWKHAFLVALTPAAGSSQVQAARNLSWRILETASAAKGGVWRILAIAAQTKTIGWRIFETTEQATTFGWRVLGAAAAARGLSYRVLGVCGAASKSLGWRILAAVVQAKALGWQVFALAAAARSLSYRVRTTAATARSASWRVLGLASAARSLVWHLGGAPPVLIAEQIDDDIRLSWS